MTELKIVGNNAGVIGAELKPDNAKEISIWLMYFLDHDNFLIKFYLKRGKNGRVKAKIWFNAKDNYHQILMDIKLKVSKLINNS